jgi:lysozyme family protein
MQTAFEFCVEHVFIREGGFVNHPSDKGGPTKFGITKVTLANFRKLPVNDKEVFELKREEAEAIYRTRFWEPMRLDRLRSRKVQLILFDQGVNRGAVATIRILQEVLSIYCGKKIQVDGVLGDSTESAIMTCDENLLCRKLIQAFQRKYAELTVKDRSQSAFLIGWLSRTFALWDAIS